MQCERCSKKDATVHLTEIIEGVKSEVHLCEKCARDIGLNSKLSSFSLAVPDFLSFLNDEIQDAHRMADGSSAVCNKCGVSLEKLRRKRRVGCALCYSFFREEIIDLIGEENQPYHTGKEPENCVDIAAFTRSSEKRPEAAEEVSVLKSRLDEAVHNEEYEQAALLRDRIRELKQICRE